MKEFTSATIKSFFTSRSEREGSKTAIVDYDTGETWTYSQLSSAAGRIAYYLKNELNLKKGDRVAVCARNGFWSVAILYAMPIIGTIMTTYNCMLKVHDLCDSVAKESPRVLFYEQLYQEKVNVFRKILKDTVFIPVDQKNIISESDFNSILKGPDWDEEWTSLDGGDICMLLHTGGSTGLPKAAMISYKAVILNTIGQIINYSIGETAIVYVSFPFFHTASWNSALPVLISGGKLFLKKKFDVVETLKMVDEEHLTSLAGSPSVFLRMSLCEEFQTCTFQSVRALRCGSATPTKALMEKYWAKGDWLLFYNGYGMTEAGSGTLSLPISSMTREQAIAKAGSVGKPMIFTQIRIVDEEGKDVPPNTEGELIVKNEIMFSGYWNDPEETKAAVRNGWLYTGDIGRYDDDGFYFISGRKKNMYISGGENIYPLEIETVLLDHPKIADAYVFGVEDDVWGEVGKALVTLRKNAELSRDELQSYMKAALSTIKIPKYVQFVEAVPRNEAGKIVGEEIKRVYSFPGEM